MPLRFDVDTLPRRLAEAGYCTQLIHDTPHLINSGHNFDWPFHAWTFIRGAEVDRPWINDSKLGFPENWRLNPLFDFVDEGVLQGRRNYVIINYSRSNRKRKHHEDWNAAKLFLTASEWLKDNASRDNFFLWIDCFDPHEPWDVPPEFAVVYDKEPDYDGRIDPRCFAVHDLTRVPHDRVERVREHIKALYAAKVSWVDHWLGTFLDTLARTELIKNTAIILTADHGTNVGERNQFGKRFPVREQEGHIPLFIHVPGYGSGRSSVFVQPQDLFATILGIAGVEPAEELDSNNVLELASKRVKCSDGPRRIALSGRPAHAWNENPELPQLTVFGFDYYLELAAKPAACSLTRYGSLENVASSQKLVLEEMREAAIDELKRWGTSSDLLKWLCNNGETGFPKIESPKPPGFDFYWKRLYNKW
ncbi:MAG: sulfatase-like hydrolase/transferase, partial [Nitrososphaerota archaeon]